MISLAAVLAGALGPMSFAQGFSECYPAPEQIKAESDISYGICGKPSEQFVFEFEMDDARKISSIEELEALCEKENSEWGHLAFAWALYVAGRHDRAKEEILRGLDGTGSGHREGTADMLFNGSWRVAVARENPVAACSAAYDLRLRRGLLRAPEGPVGRLLEMQAQKLDRVAKELMDDFKP